MCIRDSVLGVVTAEYLGADSAAIPISSNDAAMHHLKKSGTIISLTRIGSPHVIVAMEDLRNDYENVVGWEVNGGFFTSGDIDMDGAVLSALPTRDAVLPMICAVLSAKDKSLKVSELFAGLPERYTQAGLIDNFDMATSAKIIEALSGDIDKAMNLINKVFLKDHGFGDVESIDTTDGVRIYFDNGDVAHLRPSGNAPQLRMYSNANTQERADQIVEHAIREPDGLLRAVESHV